MPTKINYTQKQLKALPTSKKKAIEAGSKHYFNNRPCKNGHLTHRLALDSGCADCINERVQQRYASNREYFRKLENARRRANPEKTLYKTAKYRAERKGWEFTIELEDIVIPTHCPILGIKLELCTGSSKAEKDTSPSIDRIDSLKGYIKGNIEVISLRANVIKNNATSEELMLVAKYYQGKY